MNQKTAKRLRRFSEVRESNPDRQKRIYKNAKRIFKRANILYKTVLNKMVKKELNIV
jgi:hypothetical protein